MDAGPKQNSSPLTDTEWMKALLKYRDPDSKRSILELAITLVPFTVLWAVCWLSIHFSLWVGLLLVVPAAGFLLRLFIIQHDCGHGAFFCHRRSDDWTGRALGVLTYTPYDYWRRRHASHHATTGNLDHRGMGDVMTLTVKEYRSRSRWEKIGYRLYRNPVVLFGLGPSWLFLLEQRGLSA